MYARDMQESVDRILEWTTGIEKGMFLSDRKTYDAVVRNLILIGEAAGRIPEEAQAKVPELDFRRLRGLRNILAHAYFGVDDDVLWDIVENHVPALREQIEGLLGE